ncbi:PST family polysaccharide transporter [Polymorphobacter multimanifer]|uniref:PST family polysaccharide transporter n=1 Tax=Polymorphobacter multimanifer TaxID=1070431 RepID=A0A841L1V3_9SPHN|nr:flippase [Polymorphobacter multimanifer]MBB6226564.1 PST family polysaccharide transporter [Polymorphobacter multimanifer]
MDDVRPGVRKRLGAGLSAAVARRPVLASIARNAGWQVSDRVLRMGVGVFVSVWIARTLGPADFGALGWMQALAGLFLAVTSLGMAEIMVRELVRAPEDAPELMGTALAMQLAGGSIGYGLLIITVMLLRPGDGDTLLLALVLGIGLVAQASDVVRYWHDARLESRYAIWVTNGVFAVVSLVRVALLLAGAPLLAFAIMISVEAVLTAAALLVLQSRRQGGLFQWKPRLARARRLLGESWPLLFASIAVLINMRIDQVMLGEMASNTAVGLYTAAVRLSEIWYFVPMVIVASAFPALVAVHGKDERAANWQWRRLYALMFWMALAAGMGASVLARLVVTLLYGADYAGAGAVLEVHIWSGLGVCLGAVWSKWMLLEGKLRLTLFVHVMSAVTNIGCNLWLIPDYGAMGAAMATLIASLLSAFMSFFLHRPSVVFGHLAAAIMPWRLGAV